MMRPETECHGEPTMPPEAERSGTEHAVNLRSTSQDSGLRKKNRATRGGKPQIKGSSTPNPRMNKRRKFLDHNYMRNQILKGYIFTKYIPIKFNVCDMINYPLAW